MFSASMQTPMQFVIFAVFFAAGAASFELGARSRATWRIEAPSRRRDVLSSIIPVGIALVAAPCIALAKDDQKQNYQGVYKDPNHPKGYRILFGDNKKATVQLADEANGKVFELPVKVNKSQLAFDFSPKGGPQDVIGSVGTSDVSGEKTITFPDGNTWTEVTKSITGVYRDEQNDQYVTIRQWKGAELKVELIDGSETIASFGAKAGSKKAFFEYPGEFNKAGFINEDSISFRDGSVWTKY